MQKMRDVDNATSSNHTGNAGLVGPWKSSQPNPKLVSPRDGGEAQDELTLEVEVSPVTGVSSIQVSMTFCDFETWNSMQVNPVPLT
jgi:hypothetical protein